MQKMKAGFSEIARGILYVAWFVLTGLVVMWGLVVLTLLYMVSSAAFFIDSESAEREPTPGTPGSSRHGPR